MLSVKMRLSLLLKWQAVADKAFRGKKLKNFCLQFYIKLKPTFPFFEGTLYAVHEHSSYAGWTYMEVTFHIEFRANFAPIWTVNVYYIFCLAIFTSGHIWPQVCRLRKEKKKKRKIKKKHCHFCAKSARGQIWCLKSRRHEPCCKRLVPPSCQVAVSTTTVWRINTYEKIPWQTFLAVTVSMNKPCKCFYTESSISM